MVHQMRPLLHSAAICTRLCLPPAPCEAPAQSQWNASGGCTHRGAGDRNGATALIEALGTLLTVQEVVDRHVLTQLLVTSS